MKAILVESVCNVLSCMRGKIMTGAITEEWKQGAEWATDEIRDELQKVENASTVLTFEQAIKSHLLALDAAICDLRRYLADPQHFNPTSKEMVACREAIDRTVKEIFRVKDVAETARRLLGSL